MHAPDCHACCGGPSLGYFAFRVTLGVNFLMHGLVRIFGDWDGFVHGYILKTFKDTILPEWMLFPYAWSLPVAEAIIGAFLIVGLLTKWNLLAGSLVMTSLVFGMCLVQNWSAVGSQMIYALCFFILMYTIHLNHISVDAYLFGDTPDAPGPAGASPTTGAAMGKATTDS